MNNKLVSLDTLKKGDIAVIKNVGHKPKRTNLSKGAGIDEITNSQVVRLLEMGFYEGAIVQVMHFGILGKDPIAIRFKGNSAMVAIRKKDAKIILVDPSHA